MDEKIKDAERYLAARLVETEHRPDLHTHTRAVYEKYLSIIRERPGDYVREVGDMFPVMQAEQIDRNANYISMYKKFGNRERVEAYEIRLDALKASSGYGDLYTKNGEAQKKTDPLLQIEYARRECVENLFRQIVAWKVEIAKEKKSRKAQVTLAWTSLAELDNELSWSSFRDAASYRNCIYYNDEQLTLLERWFTEAVQ